MSENDNSENDNSMSIELALMVELAYKDIESLCPQVKQYIIDYFKEKSDIFILDSVTYIGAPIIAKRTLSFLIREHGEYILQRAVKLWIKKHTETLKIEEKEIE